MVCPACHKKFANSKEMKKHYRNKTDDVHRSVYSRKGLTADTRKAEEVEKAAPHGKKKKEAKQAKKAAPSMIRNKPSCQVKNFFVVLFLTVLPVPPPLFFSEVVKVLFMHSLFMGSFISPHTEKRRSDCHFKKFLTTGIRLVVKWRVCMYTDDKINIKGHQGPEFKGEVDSNRVRANKHPGRREREGCPGLNFSFCKNSHIRTHDDFNSFSLEFTRF